MAWTEAFPQAFAGTFQSVEASQARAEKALRWPVGAISPLWAVFGAAASAGVAWWWLTRWTQVVNVEALAGAAAQSTATVIEIAADAGLQTEEAVEPAFEAVQSNETPAAKAETVEAVAAEQPPPAVEPPADDLTRMTGIGPKLSTALAERGVTRFQQIAAWTAEDLAEADAALSLKGRAVREAWVAQARRLAQG